MNYDKLSTKEKRIFDAGGRSSIKQLKLAMAIVLKNNPHCDNIKLNHLNMALDQVTENYNQKMSKFIINNFNLLPEEDQRVIQDVIAGLTTNWCVEGDEEEIIKVEDKG